MTGPVERLSAGIEGQRLELVELTKRYHHDGPAALDAVSLSVEPGEFLALLGASGSGKTTALMLTAGFLKPTAGDVRVGGRSIVELPPERRSLGIVFQNYALFPHMSVRENVAFPLQMRRQDRAKVRAGVSGALELVGLEHLEDRYPHQLSGGQQQRVALARALVFRPPLLLMDEPLGALDKQLREQMQRELRSLHQELHMTVVYVTHDQREALTLADRIAVMREGRIEQLAAPSDLYSKPANRFVAGFIGDCNLLTPDEWSAVDDLWRVRIGDQELTVAGPGPGDHDGAQLAVRPHAMRLSSGLGVGLPGRIVDTFDLGDAVEHRVELDHGETVIVRLAAPNLEGAQPAGEGTFVELIEEALVLV